MNEDESLSTVREPRVAIIAVHGVADQKPTETARSVAKLIQKKGDAGCPVFTEKTVNLSVEPAQETKTESLDSFGERISAYEPKEQDAVFRTVILSGKAQLDRSHAFGGEECVVDDDTTTYSVNIDVIEMFWADLSSIRNGVFHSLIGLYRLFISICDIAAHSLGSPNPNPHRFNATSLSAFIISKALPILNLCLLSLFIFQLPFWFANYWSIDSQEAVWQTQRLLASLIVAFVAGGITAYWGRRVSVFPFNNHALLGLLSLIFMCIAGQAVIWLTGIESLRFPTIVAATWLPSAIAVVAICGPLDRDIPGIRKWSVVFTVFLQLAMVVRAAFNPFDAPWAVLIMGMRAAELVVLLTVTFAGVFFISLASLTIRHAMLCLKETNRPSELRRIRWTNILAILTPGIVLSISNVGVWQAIESGRPVPPIAKTVAYESDFPSPYVWVSAEFPSSSHGRTSSSESNQEFTLAEMPLLLIRLVSIPLSVFVSLAIIWSITTAWLLLPCVHAETATVSPGSGENQSDRTGMRDRSMDLGVTLTSSFRSISHATMLMLILSIPMYVIVYVYALHFILTGQHAGWFSLVCKASTYSVTIVGLFFLAAITGLLQRSSTVLHAGTDIAVDVANWLRRNPRDNNPSSRISARYVSVLRYVSNRKDVDGSDYYDGVVVLAHSLGSVISADVLRHLSRHQDKSLEAFNTGTLPIYLFSFGSPLRQLLGRRLPSLYGWAFDEREMTNDDHLGDDRLPEPEQLLAVREWVNAYCSGDYVGRTLWLDEHQESAWSTQVRESAHRREFCVGAGAHTRYWNLHPLDSDQARRIAREMGRLVLLASRGGR